MQLSLSLPSRTDLRVYQLARPNETITNCAPFRTQRVSLKRVSRVISESLIAKASAMKSRSDFCRNSKSPPIVKRPIKSRDLFQSDSGQQWDESRGRARAARVNVFDFGFQRTNENARALTPIADCAHPSKRKRGHVSSLNRAAEGLGMAGTGFTVATTAIRDQRAATLVDSNSMIPSRVCAEP